jgi:hypothetical protein
VTREGRHKIEIRTAPILFGRVIDLAEEGGINWNVSKD